MSDTQARDARDHAFVILRELVREDQAAGRSRTAAGMKSRLQQRTQQRFSEEALGFATFRQFLRAAEAAGHVRIDEGAQDLMIALPNEVPLRHPETETAPVRLIRQDFWRRFNDPRPDWHHWYDSAADRAISVPAHASPLDTESDQQLRRSVEEGTGRYVRITPVSSELQLEWMQRFLETHPDHPVTPVLATTLRTPRPVAAFLNGIRGTSLAGEWHRTRVRQVTKLIEAWATEHHLVIDIFQARDRTAFEDARVSSPAAGPDEAAVRERVKSAIDAMPLHEVLRLSIPVEFLI